jgi:hypothetical protein
LIVLTMPCATASATATLVSAGLDLRIVPQSPGTAAATDVAAAGEAAVDGSGSGAPPAAAGLLACATWFSRPVAS